jgi:serine/threonine-protein kinase
VLQACEALAEAHAIGIVHRDIKPGNLFLTERADGSPCVKVLDFGISKMSAGDASHAMTRTAAMMGSPVYMSPEQLNSARDVDARADVWSLGVSMYELLTGAQPFVADTLPQLCMRIVNEEAAPARTLRADLPEALDRAILRCLEKDRSRRFANVAELAN